MWIVNVVVLLFIVDKTLCCSCEPGHIQNGFCRSGVVIQGKATRSYYPDEVSVDKDKNKDPNNLDIIEIVTTYPRWDRKKIYDVEVIKVFKVPDTSNIKAGDVIQAVTLASGSMCGGWLGLNEELLITGGLDNKGRLSFGLCSYKKKFSKLTKLQLDGIQGAYDCDCEINHFWYSNGGDKNSCQISVSPFGYDYQCINNYGRCKKGKKEGCEWEITDESCGANPNSLP